TPEEVYYRPRTLFVAQFLGQTNLLLTEAQGTQSDSVLGRLTLHREAAGTVLVSIRPEHLSLTLTPETEHCRAGTVTARAFKGHDVTYRVQLGPVDCLVHTDNRHGFTVGDTVWVRALEPAVVLEKAGR
ncbi:MAG: TOBE domain-containing protein, partial [Bacteroidota bacterium]